MEKLRVACEILGYVLVALIVAQFTVTMIHMIIELGGK